MPQYPTDIIQVIDGVRRNTSSFVVAQHSGSTGSVPWQIANLTLTPSTETEPTTGVDIGIVTIDFDEASDNLVDPIQYYEIAWNVPGGPVSKNLSVPPPPIVYYGLPLGIELTFTVTPITIKGARGTPVSDTVTVPFDDVAPVQPSTPAVNQALYGVEVVVDGLDVNTDPQPPDFARFVIYTGPGVGFDVDTQGTKVAEIASPFGGSRFIWSYDAEDEIFVRVTGVDRYGNESVPSTTASAIPLSSTVSIEPGSIGYEDIAFKQADNLIPDGSFEDASYRAKLTAANFVQDTAEAYHGDWMIEQAATGTDQDISLLEGLGVGPGGKCMQVGPYEKFLLRCAYRSTVGANGTSSLRLLCYASDGTPLTEPNIISMVPSTTDDYDTASSFMVPPTGTVFVEPRITIESSSTTGTWDFDAVEFRRVMQTAIIDDLAVTDAQIESLTVEKLSGGVGEFDMVVGGSLRSVARTVTGLDIGPVMDPQGFHNYDDTGQAKLNFPSNPSPDNPNFFGGAASLQEFTVEQGGSLRGDVELAREGRFILRNKTTKPGGSPTETNTFDRVLFQAAVPSKYGTLPPSVSNDPSARLQHMSGLAWTGTDWLMMESENWTVNGFAIWRVNPDGTPTKIYYLPKTGVRTPYQSYYKGITYVNGRIFTLHYYLFDDSIYWQIAEIVLPASSAATVTLAPIPTPGNPFYKTIPEQGLALLPTIGNDGTNVVLAWAETGNERFTIRTYNILSSALGDVGTSSTNVATSGWFPGVVTSMNVTGISKGSFDMGASSWVLTLRYLTHIRVFNSSTGAERAGYGWNVSFPSDAENTGLAYDGTNFYGLHKSGFTKYSRNWWIGDTTSDDFWAGYNWKDTDAAGTGTHQTELGPVTRFEAQKRAVFNFAVAPIPDYGGTDDANAFSLYVGQGSTKPALTAMWLQALPANGAITLLLRGPLATSGSHAGGLVNNFTSGTPAEVLSDTGGVSLKADGTGSVGTVAESGGLLHSVRSGVGGRISGGVATASVAGGAGEVTFNHGLGTTPGGITVTPETSTVRSWRITAKTATTVSVQCRDQSGSIFSNGTSVTFNFTAYATA